MEGNFGVKSSKFKTLSQAEKERREKKKTITLKKIEEKAEKRLKEIINSEDNKKLEDNKEIEIKQTSSNSLKVSDIMIKNIISVKPDDTLITVKGIFSTKKFHHLPVVDDNGKLLGIISDSDLLKNISPFLGTVNEQTRDIALLNKYAHTIMIRKIVSIGKNATIEEAVGIMATYNVSCLPVIEPNTKQLLGIITWKDFVIANYPSIFKMNN